MTEAPPGLFLGLDRTDITPRRPIPLAGYAARAELGPASDVAAPLRLRTMTFRHGPERAVLVSADLLWWGTDTTARVQQHIADRYGLAPESVLLHATHAHSGPQTSNGFTPLLGEPDSDYIDELCAAAVDSVGRALDAEVAVNVERASGRLDMGVDRRHARTLGAVAAAPVDDEVTVVRFVRGGRTVALLTHYACHPVVHHGNAVTSDFTGAAMDLLERRHPGALAVYVQGCCGDVNPGLYTDGEYHDGDQRTVDAVGTRLADAVDAALARGTRPVGAAGLCTSSRLVDLPVASMPTVAHLRHQAHSEGLPGQWARLLLDRPERLRPTVAVRLSVLRIADGLALLGMSGEPVSTYGLMVKSLSQGGVLPMGYTNGMTGYLVTARQLDEGGYEVDEAPYYFGMPGRLSPDAERVLRDALRDTVGRVHRDAPETGGGHPPAAAARVRSGRPARQSCSAHGGPSVPPL